MINGYILRIGKDAYIGSYVKDGEEFAIWSDMEKPKVWKRRANAERFLNKNLKYMNGDHEYIMNRITIEEV